MAGRCSFAIILWLSLLLAEARSSISSEVYVVYMGSKSYRGDPEEILSAVHGGSKEKGRASHVYSYGNSFRGFAAKLTEEQALKMAEMPGVVSVFPNLKRRLHTTHSWDFMGLNADAAMEIPGFSTKNQENVIIGFIDTGIWPESPCFIDEGMPPVPSRWRGVCEAGDSFSNSSCNKKVIGARYYLGGYEAEEEMAESPVNSVKNVNFKSPRDSSGHGSHTASTAAGSYVNDMNYNGLADGGARGGAPMARIAVYKACWDSGCYDADLLAAFDDAIKDGVDIISISLGPESPQGDYFNDAISIGSFHAVSKGIVVVSSAGNVGTTRGSATNLAPWMFTVAASSTDRDFVTDVKLGNGVKLAGVSLNTIEMNSSVQTIAASDANAGYFTPYQSSYCLESSLNRTKARGKVLICKHSESSSESRLEKSLVVKKAGGVGLILISENEDDVAVPFIIPAATVGVENGDKILSYVNQTRRPSSLILPTKTVLGSRTAPQVAAFSSRGPNSLTPEILKPDIMAPGLNILAAWSPANKKMKFNILSGTSMSCPHITGLVALIKAVYPSWSPAAIKSAIMTTATTLNKNGRPISEEPKGKTADPFSYGSGFPVPANILTPGLIYDAQPSDYKAFLCSIGYDDNSLQQITGDKSVCIQPSPSASNLNYPSITVPELKNSISIERTVTNVGNPRSIYRSVVHPPSGINVTVIPKFLVFSRYGEKLRFTVNFRVEVPSKDYVFGSLSWKSEDARVTSPLVVRVVSSSEGLM
ncbi:Subtilisin-like protease [Apostasia shenzhenica]|uniref:Subtilisin-like protease n=1 Tax=Apostasia shenzhenica TaxID=1088818 RepID=A0A2I0ABF3_9ASPA|nr:Subtilisin-like protease [Apostasia shenzhenica]